MGMELRIPGPTGVVGELCGDQLRPFPFGPRIPAPGRDRIPQILVGIPSGRPVGLLNHQPRFIVR